MDRGLIFGAIAFGVVYFAHKQFGALGSDLARYDRLRAMSGEGSFLKEQLKNGIKMLSEYGQSRQGGAMSFLGSLESDLMRYARMRSM